MEKTSKMSNTAQVLLWFGAAVSLAEILTGTFLAPLGLGRGMLAVAIGHLVGAVVFYFVGYIGANENVTAIESTGISFGRLGVKLFSVLNVIQLVGWTAIMTESGAAALISGGMALPNALLCAIIGAFILVFVLVGFKNLTVINYFAIGALFCLTVVLAIVVFRGMDLSPAASETLSFGAAVELSVTMPLSWLPLISDYTKNNRHKAGGTLAATCGYFIGSCTMYIIGLGAAIYSGESDVSAILSAAGVGAAAVIIALLSTVTTTFLDVYSGGVSVVNVSKKVGEKAAAVIVLVLGIALAIFAPVSQFEGFLYFIGSVFAPLFSVLLVDYYLYRKKGGGEKSVDVGALAVWAVGFAIYRVILNYDTPVGTTLPVMVGTSAIYIFYKEMEKLCSKKH